MKVFGYVGAIQIYLCLLVGCYCFSQNTSNSPDLNRANKAIKFDHKNLKKSDDDDKIWLNLYNDQGAFSQILIGFIEGATNGYDRDYDGYRFFGSNPIAFYSLIDEIRLAIQGRAPRTLAEERVPLGVTVEIVEEITLFISIDDLEGALNEASIELLLEDNLLNITHDLKTSPYEFQIENSGSYDNRFNLLVKDLGVLSVEDNSMLPEVLIHSDNNYLKVKSTELKVKQITVFDTMGRKLIDQSPEKYEFSILLNQQKYKPVLFVSLVFENGERVSRKIIF